jgi:hypothetical protein
MKFNKIMNGLVLPKINEFPCVVFPYGLLPDKEDALNHNKNTETGLAMTLRACLR